jgi:hypothetical protein
MLATCALMEYTAYPRSVCLMDCSCRTFLEEHLAHPWCFPSGALMWGTTTLRDGAASAPTASGPGARPSIVRALRERRLCQPQGPFAYPASNFLPFGQGASTWPERTFQSLGLWSLSTPSANSSRTPPSPPRASAYNRAPRGSGIKELADPGMHCRPHLFLAAMPPALVLASYYGCILVH